MKKLHVGVIGLGMGRAHLRDFKNHPKVKVGAIADLDKDRLEAVGTEYGVDKRYTDPLKMLAEQKLDLVSIATPNKFHRPLTVEAFKHGCHVLCEKPMAMNAQEGEEMLEASRKAGKRLMINFSFRFTEQSWALKKQVESGVLGDVYFGRTVWHRRRGMPGFGGWFGQKELAGGGPLIDLGVHRLDLALWLMGYPKPSWVIGATYDAIATKAAAESGKKFDVEDLAAAFIRFENGASLVVEASWAANIKERELMETRLLGTEGGLVQRNLREGYEFEAEMYVEKNGCLFDMAVHPPVPAAKSAYHHFVDCILNDEPHTATGEEGLIVMRLLDAIYQSAESGEPVKVG